MANPPSPRLGLFLPALTDRFKTEDIKGNFDKIDAAPGTHICTSTTRPTGWGAPKAGRKIYETNTGLEWVWNGTDWDRLTGGRGILTLSGGQPAIAERTSQFSTTSNTFVKVVTLSNVVVPGGHRPLMIVGTWMQADNSDGPGVLSIFRSAADASGPQMSKTFVAPSPGSKGNGGSSIAFERGGLQAGTYDFSLQLRSGDAGGRTYMYADNAQPIQLTVIEL